MLLPPFLLLVFIMLLLDRILTHIVIHLSNNTSYHLQFLYCPGRYVFFQWKFVHGICGTLVKYQRLTPKGCRFVPRHDRFRNTIFVSYAITNNTNCVPFIALTVTVKHVVRGRNKQVLPQWICLRCNIQFDNMGSVIFLECTHARSVMEATPHTQNFVCWILNFQVNLRKIISLEPHMKLKSLVHEVFF